MTERKKKFFSGPSLEAALVSAASEYGLTPEQVSYQVIEKRHGFLRIRRNVVIQVDPDSPRKAEDARPTSAKPKTSKPSGAPAQKPDDETPDDETPDDEAPDGADAQALDEETSDEGTSDEGTADEETDDVEIADEGTDEDGSDSDDDGDDETDDDGSDDDADEDSSDEDDEDRQPKRSRQARPEMDDRPPLRPRSRGARSEAQDEPQPQPPKGRGRAGAKEREPARDAKKEPEETREPKESRRRARRQEPEKAAPKRPPRKRREIEPIEMRLKPAKGPLAKGALEATEWLLDLLDIDVDPKIFEGEDRLEIELRGPDRKYLVGDNGEVLSAIEHLVPRVMRGVCGDTHPVRVDSENFQEEREDRLREMAWETGDHVRQEGQPKILDAMDPADRRIIHLALSDDPDVTTRSLGEGFFKRVKVLLK